MSASNGGGVELEDLSKEDKDREERLAFEKSLNKTLKEGDIDDITDQLSPPALTKCDTNALLKAMEVNCELRRLADKKGPDEEEITKLVNSVDEFTSCLLDPLKSNREARHAFGDSLEDVMDAAIELKQKKFLAHPILYNLKSKRWFGELGRIRCTSWLDAQRWKWFFLNIWCLFDLVLFPVLFPMFYMLHLIRRRTRKNKALELVFVLSATSEVADQAFILMKDSLSEIIKGCVRRINYQVIIQGEDVSNNVKELKKGKAEIPTLHNDLQRAIDAFKNNTVRQNAEKVLILFTDRKVERNKKKLVKDQVEGVREAGARIIPVAIGTHVNLRDLQKMTVTREEIIHFGEYEDYRKVGKRILQEIDGKDMYDSYYDYFTIPYIVFVRDTLSYLALLGLHFAICLAPSSIAFSGVEWAILVFFMGRIVMESKQFWDTKVERSRGIHTTYHGLKYTSCDDLEEGGEQERTSKGKTRTAVLLKKIRKYLGDRWNILDFITVLIYLFTFVLRVVTWSTYDHVANNRALVVSGYLYGLNTMFLTLRAFGHVMESAKGIGAIQIALFHIFGDVAVIFWQFLATILAFSIALTKIYMAEKSYITDATHEKDLACSSSGISCWWAMAKHLCWSLLGIADLGPLDSIDNPSVVLAHFLYGTFLIMGVILLINMMIALLSNTYQRVEDNALNEWSYKKAITIQTYSAYHPIPVPLNLVSNLFMVLRYLWYSCKTRCNEQERNKTDKTSGRNKSLDAVVKELQLMYFAKYGYCFPLTDERKLDHVLLETDRNREMANQIVHRSFSACGENQGNLPTGPKAWRSMGIRVEGCLLTCEGAEFCSVCKDDPFDHHGARYKLAFTPECPHFEVLIQETGERRFLGVGVVWEDYVLHGMPGWVHGTVGYHVDDGKIFDADSAVNGGREVEDAMAYRGDLIGCTVKFELAANGKVPIVFTLNGRQITADETSIEYDPGKRSLYPYIGMGHKGIRLRPIDMDGHAQAYSKDDDRWKEREMISLALDGLEKVQANIRDSFVKVRNEMKEVHKELDYTGVELRRLAEDIYDNFESIEMMLKNQHWDCQKMSDPGLMWRDLHCLQELERNKQEEEHMTNLELIKRVNEITEQLERLTNEESTSAFKTLAEIKKDGKKQVNDVKGLRGSIEEKFSEMKKLIRSHCTFPESPKV